MPECAAGVQLWPAIRGAGVVVLALGGAGVLDVGLVTVRQRIREIGVRRSSGASSARISSAVVLESVCATALAGVAAVAAAVVLVRTLPLEQWLTDGVPLADDPGFPVAAAVEGMVAATAVGALAGLVPALVAVRARVIDAIRFQEDPLPHRSQARGGTGAGAGTAAGGGTPGCRSAHARCST